MVWSERAGISKTLASQTEKTELTALTVSQIAKPCSAVCKKSANPKKQKAQPKRAGLCA
jgi:hypothetical protein